jgi:hypothetical protein
MYMYIIFYIIYYISCFLIFVFYTMYFHNLLTVNIPTEHTFCILITNKCYTPIDETCHFLRPCEGTKIES